MCELELFLEENMMTFFCVCEHWLLPDEALCYTFRNFNVGNIYCRQRAIHGGVAIYIRKEIDFQKVYVEQFCDNFNFEATVVYVPNQNCVIVAIYRSPNGDIFKFLSRFTDLLDFVSMKIKSQIIVAGDFNIDFLKSSPLKNTLLDIVQSYNLKCLVNEPTKINLKSKTCYDNIMTNLSVDYNLKIHPHKFGDHLGITLCFDSFNAPLSDYALTKYRPINSANLLKFYESVAKLDFSNVYKNTEPAEVAFNSFHITIVDTFKNCFPEITSHKKINRNRKLNWFTEDLRKLRSRVDAMDVVRRNTNSEVLLKYFVSVKSDYRRMLIQAKRDANDKFINNAVNKSKAVWHLINSELNISKKQYQKNNFSADEFNIFFTEVAHNIVKNLPSKNNNSSYAFLNNSRKSPINSFYFEHTTDSEVIHHILSLKNSTSRDTYGLNAQVIKHISLIVSKPLSHLINRCVDEEVFPRCLKIAKTVALFKKGDSDEIGNYRPISILPIFSKIFESIIKDRLSNFFETKKLFACEQFGFRKMKNTTQAVSDIVDTIIQAFDNGESSCLTLIDLSKAFDCVDHNILLDKLYYYGIRGNTHGLMHSYLSNRAQSVFEKNSKSDERQINIGVPQGSILGPLLFLIFINDLPININESKSVLFADDINLLNVGKDEEVLKKTKKTSMKKTNEWLTANKLVMNTSKNKTILFSLKPECNLTYTGKLLGITLDAKLTWKLHIDALASKLNSVLYQLKKLTIYCQPKTALTFYHSNFKSLLTYGIMLWGDSSHVIRVFAIQKKAVRALSGCHDQTVHCKPFFKKLNILPLPCLFIFSILLYAHSNMCLFTKNCDNHKYSTRKKDNYVIPLHRLERTQQSGKFIAVKLLNCLPVELKTMNLEKYKITLKKVLMDNCFYSVEEFMSHFKTFAFK